VARLVGWWPRASHQQPLCFRPVAVRILSCATSPLVTSTSPRAAMPRSRKLVAVVRVSGPAYATRQSCKPARTEPRTYWEALEPLKFWARPDAAGHALMASSPRFIHGDSKQEPIKLYNLQLFGSCFHRTH
jgi:hypothetical protein